MASEDVNHYVHLDDGDEVGVWVRIKYTVAPGNHELSIRFTKKKVLTLSDNLLVKQSISVHCRNIKNINLNNIHVTVLCCTLLKLL